MNKTDGKNLPVLSPATDILEIEEGFHIIMDMPGVTPESLSVDIKDSELIITGQSSYPFENNMHKIHTEFQALSYRRNFSVSDLIDKNNIKARFKNGVLNLFLPKSNILQPRKITINQ